MSLLFPHLEMVFVHPRTIRALGTLAGAGLLLAGCQSYQPRPLDPELHRERWLARSPKSEDVVAFAARLEEHVAGSTTFDPTDGISLSEAEVIALVFNGDLRLARLRAGVATATAAHAGLWDDPELAIEVLRITESVSSPWVITPGIAFTIPISGRLEVEKARADAALRAELHRVAEAEWRVRRDVRRAWLAWSASVIRAAESERFVESMESLVASTTRLADAGELPRTEAALFVIEQSRRRQGLGRHRGEISAGEQRLRMLLGLSPDAPLALVAGLDAPRPSEVVAAGVEETVPSRSPELARLRAEYEVAEQALRREIRKQYPDLTIGPLYESDQGQSRIGFFGAIPLPVLNANRQGIAEARAERELARAAFETGCERLAGSLALARVRAEALRAQRAEIAEVLAPMVDSQVADARRLLELGEGGGLVLLESLVSAHDTKMQLIDVRVTEAMAAAEVAFLLGPPAAQHDPETDEPREGEVPR
ncbi:MAG: TolC family protein [Planctomycetota bacterium]|jgi:outer membrane protein TolC